MFKDGHVQAQNIVEPPCTWRLAKARSESPPNPHPADAKVRASPRACMIQPSAKHHKLPNSEQCLTGWQRRSPADADPCSKHLVLSSEMGAARKIQSEIDRTLKKVQEGIDVFDEIWSKVGAVKLICVVLGGLLRSDAAIPLPTAAFSASQGVHSVHAKICRNAWHGCMGSKLETCWSASANACPFPPHAPAVGANLSCPVPQTGVLA